MIGNISSGGDNFSFSTTSLNCTKSLNIYLCSHLLNYYHVTDFMHISNHYFIVSAFAM